jgi:hypothetical protein
MNAMEQEDSETRLSALITCLSDRLIEYYVFPEIAERIRLKLGEFGVGAVRDDSSPQGIAAALTKLLFDASKDKHLRVRWFANPAALAQDPYQGGPEIRSRAARDDQFGILRCGVISNRVGLLAISEFHPVEFMRSPLSEAMKRLEGSEYLVFDMRQCRGGEPEAVALLCSYLFSDTPVHVNDLYLRREDRTRQFWTEPMPNSPFVDVPAYVLTSPMTFSAGEEFAYNLQALHRATVIGECTRGGAHPGEVHPLIDGYAVFIPDARAINPVTGTNWEGLGVQPDMPCSADEAEDRALKLIRERVKGSG